MTDRYVIKKVTGIQAQDGAGVKLVRVVGNKDVIDFDPFLMLDAFDSQNPRDYINGFPWHPHRGIETVTYLINGNIEHTDSLGNKGTIKSGDAQWMTAGSGILHQEMPQPAGRMVGYQLWINLPRENKMTQPKYFDITSSMVKEVKIGNSVVRIIGGEFNGIPGPAQGEFVKADLYDVIVPPNEILEIPTDPKKNVFVYLFGGSAKFGEPAELIPAKCAALFSRGDRISVHTGSEGVRFAYFAGMPIAEPIAWGGPVVMNTRSELNKAFDELNTGTFIKHKVS